MRPLNPATQQVVLRRITRPAYIIGALSLVIALVAVAFITGTQIQAPAEIKTGAATVLPAVTAHVELRVVNEGLQLPGKVIAPETLELKLSGDGQLGIVTTHPTPPPATGTATGGDPPKTEAAEQNPAAPERNVITRMIAANGNTLDPGDLLAEVSGRPIMAAPPGTPLYRDFIPGITGEDVRAVQQMLVGLGYAVNTDGVLNAPTIDAIAYWYAQLGYELPQNSTGQRSLPWKELLPLPSGELTVIATADGGKLIGADTALMQVRRGNPVVQTSVNAAQVAKFRETPNVYVQFEGKSLEAEILSIGDLETNADTNSSAHTITVACPPELVERAAEITTVSVATAQPTAASFAVPITAISEDGKARFVRLVAAQNDTAQDNTAAADTTEGSAPPGVRVDIEVLAIVGGWAAIAAHEQLPEGAEIRVD